jgi:hypothetical protein
MVTADPKIVITSKGKILFHAQASLISRDGTGVATEKTPGKFMVDKEKLTVGHPHRTDRLYTPTPPPYSSQFAQNDRAEIVSDNGNSRRSEN